MILLRMAYKILAKAQYRKSIAETSDEFGVASLLEIEAKRYIEGLEKKVPGSWLKYNEVLSSLAIQEDYQI